MRAKHGRAAGLSPRDLSMSALQLWKHVLITHTHSDHIKGLDVCMKRLPCPIFMSSTSKDKLMLETAISLGYGTRTQIVPGLWVTAFPTSHDCPGSVGYILESGSHRVGYATDLGIVTEEILSLLSDSDCVVIESNHDEEMLRYGSYPAYLKMRILSDHGHLSNESCAEAVAWLAEHGTKHFFLAHLSQHNNLPELALSASEKTTAGMNVTLNVLPAVGGDSVLIDKTCFPRRSTS